MPIENCDLWGYEIIEKVGEMHLRYLLPSKKMRMPDSRRDVISGAPLSEELATVGLC